MAKPPICPSKLPITPIASPTAQKKKASVIRRGNKPMPPMASIVAGKASRMANSMFPASDPHKGKKNQSADNRKMTITIKALFFAISIWESIAKGLSIFDNANL